MNELERSLTDDSAFTPPSQILGGIPIELASRSCLGAPHTIYGELWHTVFWLRMTLDWVNEIETPMPAHAADGFPTPVQVEAEPWSHLVVRFFAGLDEAAAITRNAARLSAPVRCPSLPDRPPRIMSVEEQLISLAAHNAYHLGRIVLLRQLAGSWPPAEGGFTW